MPTLLFTTMSWKLYLPYFLYEQLISFYLVVIVEVAALNINYIRVLCELTEIYNQLSYLHCIRIYRQSATPFLLTASSIIS